MLLESQMTYCSAFILHFTRRLPIELFFVYFRFYLLLHWLAAQGDTTSIIIIIIISVN